jgi:hypothetical protein
MVIPDGVEQEFMTMAMTGQTMQWLGFMFLADLEKTRIIQSKNGFKKLERAIHFAGYADGIIFLLKPLRKASMH